MLLFIAAMASPPAPVTAARIVSLAPALSEIVCALGAENRLVGVTRFDDYPETLTRLPKVGGFTDPSLDAIAALHPDLVLLNPNESNENFTHALDHLQIRWLALEDAHLSDFAPMVRTIAKLLAAPDRGEALVTAFDRELDALPKVSGKALIVYGHRPLVAAGPGSFGAELLQRVGLQNAYGGGQRYPHLDIEAVLLAKPNFLLDLDMSENGHSDATFFAAYAAPFAARGIVVHEVADAALLRLGPRLPRAMARLAAKLVAAK